ncbi:MAG: ribonuclease Z [Pseudomonadota bacterium]
MFTLTFLGTSAGVPTKQRNVTALALETGVNRDWWLIDCGEATWHQLLRVPLSVQQLAGICITHAHGDHTYGLPGLLASAAMSGRTRPLILAAPAAVRAWLEATIRHTELFLSFPLIHVDVAAARQVHRETGLYIERFGLSHRSPSVAFRFSMERSRWTLDTAALLAAGIAPGHVWGKLAAGNNVDLPDGRPLLASEWRREQRQQAAVVIGGDNDTPSLLAEACAGAQLLVHEATYTEAQLQKAGPGPTHSSARRVAQFAAQAALPNLILTHFSARYHHPAGMAELAREARQCYAGQLWMAQDLVSYTLDPDGVVRPMAAPALD